MNKEQLTKVLDNLFNMEENFVDIVSSNKERAKDWDHTDGDIEKRVPLDTSLLAEDIIAEMEEVSTFTDKKIKVPEFLAEWFEDSSMEYLTLCTYLQELLATSNPKVSHWVNTCEGDSGVPYIDAQNIVAQMYLYGYESYREPCREYYWCKRDVFLAPFETNKWMLLGDNGIASLGTTEEVKFTLDQAVFTEERARELLGNSFTLFDKHDTLS